MLCEKNIYKVLLKFQTCSSKEWARQLRKLAWRQRGTIWQTASQQGGSWLTQSTTLQVPRTCLQSSHLVLPGGWQLQFPECMIILYGKQQPIIEVINSDVCTYQEAYHIIGDRLTQAVPGKSCPAIKLTPHIVESVKQARPISQDCSTSNTE